MTVRRGPIDLAEFRVLVGKTVGANIPLEDFRSEVKDLLRRVDEFQALEMSEMTEMSEEDKTSLVDRIMQ